MDVMTQSYIYIDIYMNIYIYIYMNIYIYIYIYTHTHTHSYVGSSMSNMALAVCMQICTNYTLNAHMTKSSIDIMALCTYIHTTGIINTRTYNTHTHTHTTYLECAHELFIDGHHRYVHVYTLTHRDIIHIRTDSHVPGMHA